MDDPVDETPETPPRHPSLDCPHGKVHTFGYGLRKCVDCGSIEGIDKVWRHPEAMWPAS